MMKNETLPETAAGRASRTPRSKKRHTLAALQLALLTTLLTAGCASPMFTLRDKSGGIHGPYPFAHGQKIGVGNDTLILHRELPPDRLVKDRMQTLLIPEVDFRNATINDIVSFLREPKTYYDPDNRRHYPPVDVVLVVPEGKHPLIPRVTLRAQSISMLATVRTVAKLAGLDFSISDGRVWLEYKP